MKLEGVRIVDLSLFLPVPVLTTMTADQAASDPPGAAQAPARAFLADSFRTRTRDQWEERPKALDLCFAPVLDMAEVFARPQMAARETAVRNADGNLHLDIPVRFREEPGRIDPRAPALGAHTREVLGKAGESERAAAPVRHSGPGR
jgi:crotonobetainyl-CoA:carnitine CoA-transferase CaiB-like acyl-CoA transferase